MDAVARSKTKLALASPNRPAIGLHAELIYGRAGKLIEAMDTIRKQLGEKGNHFNLNFPQIIVAGEESSGKSTVLERIAMLKFFPRDKAMCTRMPIQLKLQHLNRDELRTFCTKNNLVYGDDMGYARLKYEEINGQTFESPFYGLDQVESQVKSYMDQAIARRKGAIFGVTEDILSIEVTSYLVPNLTLIDLPRIFSGVKKGEPTDLPEVTEKLVQKYMSQPHTMVLVVVPAFQRIRNSPAIKIVQRLKKEKHTIGVLTMADRASDPRFPTSPFTGLWSTLNGESDHVISLPLGYVAVKNRDSELQGELGDVAKSEIAWFDKHMPGAVEEEKASNDVLIRKLSNMLCDYVEETWIPSTKKTLADKIKENEELIKSFGTDVSTQPKGYLVSVVRHFRSRWEQLFQIADDHLSEEVQKIIEVSMPTPNSLPPANLRNFTYTVLSWMSFKESTIKDARSALEKVAEFLKTNARTCFDSDKDPNYLLPRFAILASTIELAVGQWFLSLGIHDKFKLVFENLFNHARFMNSSGAAEILSAARAALEFLILEHLVIFEREFYLSVESWCIYKQLRTSNDSFLLMDKFDEDRKKAKEQLANLNEVLKVVTNLFAGSPVKKKLF
eukprot:TRINITY_DN4594_c0_g1_i1.p1 TRINITY_DN4594_c0_g1~~TRINITY_DN4594_c0_g1_i1.p1  ORF type:complete len:616 (+),score=142.41 TRINITY_DN4594_c0_g1_i1:241-2088(+)